MTACRNWLTPSTLRLVEIKLRFSDLIAKAFNCPQSHWPQCPTGTPILLGDYGVSGNLGYFCLFTASVLSFQSFTTPRLDPVTCFNDGIYLFLFIKPLSQSFGLHMKSTWKTAGLCLCPMVLMAELVGLHYKMQVQPPLLIPNAISRAKGRGLVLRQDVSTACHPLVLRTGTGPRSSSRSHFYSK